MIRSFTLMLICPKIKVDYSELQASSSPQAHEIPFSFNSGVIWVHEPPWNSPFFLNSSLIDKPINAINMIIIAGNNIFNIVILNLHFFGDAIITSLYFHIAHLQIPLFIKRTNFSFFLFT